MKITKLQLKNLILELLEAKVQLDDDDKEKIKKAKEEEFARIAAQSGPGIEPKEVEDAYKASQEKESDEINEERKRLSFASKEQGFTYGIEHLSDYFDHDSADEIVGHT